jgi:hypothetical protein
LSDIFREVDEEIRRDELKGIWDKYGLYILGLCALIIGGVGGFKGWQAYQSSQAEKAGSNYAYALDLEQAGKKDDALKAFESIASKGPNGYGNLARFRLAGAQATAGNVDQAIASYNQLAADTKLDGILRNLAQVRASYLLLDQGKSAEVEKRMTPLNVKSNPWRNSAREILALNAYQASEMRKANLLFGEIIADPTAPGGIRQRAQLMISLMAPGLVAQATKAGTKTKTAKPE